MTDELIELVQYGMVSSPWYDPMGLPFHRGLYCPPVIPAELWWISEVGWPYEIGRRARAELGRTEASPEG